MAKLKRIIDIVSSSNNVIELSKIEAERFSESWNDVYCLIAKKNIRELHFEKYKWHVFSYDQYPCMEGEVAISEYLKQSAPQYVVLPELSAQPKEVAFLIDELPSSDLVNLQRDFYVFPKNLAWTMAFTHEYDVLGPYFAYANQLQG